jgi:hypothetical protein
VSKFVVSNSALGQFFSGCPARFPFFKQYSLKEKWMPKHLKFGIAVHRIMDEGVPGLGDLTDFDEDAIMTAERLSNLAEKQGYTILQTEIKHRAALTNDIDVFGIIDALALTKEGRPILIDWKTGDYPWKGFKTEDGEVIVTKARGWQGTIYTLEPYEMPIDWDEWPSEMHYLTAPRYGTASVHPYHANDADVRNLVWAAEQLKAAADADRFPKNVGYLCRDCDWKKSCWGMSDWEKYYNVR